MTTDTYNSSDVARYCGITLRQLQWWDEKGVIKAEMKGHVRVFSQSDLNRTYIAAQLRKKGFSLAEVRVVLKRGKRLFESLTLPTWVITDGTGVIVTDEADRAMVVLQSWQGRTVVIRVDEVTKEQGRKHEAVV